ncbi:NAD(P)H-hydrate epimerase [Muriicola sp. Z0-33]|uniref:NAD(P)H-hydrate epimerase n=1 Tax=Muriicola sp. Z0-33 TaxID=2816957 RepID=UPI0022381AC2|nr:NAD(P)H-hydrate epimerase [Muriicola sp. Z0-33]MCW5517679.1 NAD(P)H-hydrate epimerase [Muriicola sp. Z0-33]
MHFTPSEALAIAAFKEMDYTAVRDYHLPIELMMENAGLMLAKLVAENAGLNGRILIGAGNGNNGGGGLVAARRLAAWGYKVYLDLPVPITKELPKRQLDRALLFGAQKQKGDTQPDVWIDAYLGFSQRSPLAEEFVSVINSANTSKALRISLDLPTGIAATTNTQMFMADIVLTLAAPKLILNTLSESTRIYIADIGIPEPLYKQFGIGLPNFYNHQKRKH